MDSNENQTSEGGTLAHIQRMTKHVGGHTYETANHWHEESMMQ